MDYNRAYKDLDKILTTTNNVNRSYDQNATSEDIISVNGNPFAIANSGEAFRSHLRDEIAYAMEDYNLSAQEATAKVTAEIKSLEDMTWWKQNAWFIRFA